MTYCIRENGRPEFWITDECVKQAKSHLLFPYIRHHYGFTKAAHVLVLKGGDIIGRLTYSDFWETCLG